jgi:hypothetical protein
VLALAGGGRAGYGSGAGANLLAAERGGACARHCHGPEPVRRGALRCGVVGCTPLSTHSPSHARTCLLRFELTENLQGALVCAKYGVLIS